MDEESSCCVPPGFRFHPTDEELVGYYLKKKLASQRIDLDVITEIDLYKIEPWDLQERCRIGYEEQKEWYFFSHKDKKYPTGTRTNRATVSGFWKATGRDKAVYQNSKLIGMRKTLVYYRGRAPNGQKSDWIIHEYYMLDSHHNSPLQEEGWVVCRAFKKRSNVGRKRRQVWDTNCFFYDPNNLLDPLPLQHIANKRSRHNNNHCKQEVLAEVNNSLMCGLPQLETTPSEPEIKSLQSCDKNSLEDEVSAEKMITDWRSLDKFVASQFLMTPQD